MTWGERERGRNGKGRIGGARGREWEGRKDSRRGILGKGRPPAVVDSQMHTEDGAGAVSHLVELHGEIRSRREETTHGEVG